MTSSPTCTRRWRRLNAEFLMCAAKMHADEVETDPLLVRRLIARQFPQWADLPVSPVASSGTDNAVYRLGDDMSVRMPRIHWAIHQIDKEREWLPKLAPHLPLKVPEPLARGEPGEGYPWHWAIYRWIAGQNPTHDTLADPVVTARELAQFLTALQKIDTTSAPAAKRGVSLTTRDAQVREAIDALKGMMDADPIMAIWDETLEAPEWSRAPVWAHGDMLPGNLLMENGRLHAVIDFSGLGSGDPACDLMIAWRLFSGESRRAFRAALGMDDATWIRGRGHALAQALIFIPYYLNTNPAGVAGAWHAIHEIVADYRGKP